MRAFRGGSIGVLMRTLKLSMCDSMAEAMCEYKIKMVKSFFVPRNIKILYNIWCGQSKEKGI